MPITASGSQFGPNENVQVRFGTLSVGAAAANYLGDMSLTFQVPNLGPSLTSVTATGQTTQAMAFSEFTITSGDLLLTLTPGRAPPGSSVTASTQGYGPGERVEVFFNAASVGIGIADASGNLAFTFTVPTQPPGFYKVAARGQVGGIQASGSFEIGPVNLTPDSTVLPQSTVGASPTPTITPNPQATLALEPAPFVQQDERYFAGTGFRVENNAIWDYFQTRGQIATFGYPISRTFQLLGCYVQMFQRQVAQVCADGSVHLMNILDPDFFPYTRVNGSIFPGPEIGIKSNTPLVTSPSYATDIVSFVQSTAPNSFNGQPVNFAATFFSSIGVDQAGTDDPNVLALLDLEIWGAPISQPMVDPSNADFIYQRFQRGIMHYIAGTGTQGILLADYLKAIMMNRGVPPDLLAQAQGSRFFGQYCPTNPVWLCRPAELPASNFAHAFDPG